MTPVLIACTVLACTVLAGFAIIAAAWAGAAAWRIIDRSRCAVCQGGGHPADYPTPSGWPTEQYRMCLKHLAQNKRRAYLEQETP